MALAKHYGRKISSGNHRGSKTALKKTLWEYKPHGYYCGRKRPLDVVMELKWPLVNIEGQKQPSENITGVKRPTENIAG